MRTTNTKLPVIYILRDCGTKYFSFLKKDTVETAGLIPADPRGGFGAVIVHQKR